MTTSNQRRRALDRANEVRAARADIKRRVAAGDLQGPALIDGTAGKLADRLEEIQGRAEEMRIGELIRAIPGIGPTTAAELLDSAGVVSDRTALYRLSARTRAALAAAIREQEER